MWTALGGVTKDGIAMRRMAEGVTLATLVLIPLEEMVKGLYFLGVHLKSFVCLGVVC